jgi:GT2 family glycosyltransferase
LSVSVIVPFRGGRGEAEAMLRALRRLELQAGDELIVADNSDRLPASVAGPTVRELVARAGDAVRVVPATAERSSYHARNAGAAVARNDWLLFMDADCAPRPSLVERFLSERVPDSCGAIAGQIFGEPDQRSFAARYARSRRLFDQADGLIRAEAGAAAAGNLLVRRAAFVELGGFTEGIRSGGDVDLCRRLGRAGWRLEFRPQAVVHHRHRATLPSLLGAVARYGAGARWLNERYPGSAPRWPVVRGLAGAIGDGAKLAIRGRLQEAVFRAVDGLGLIAHNLGYLAGNSAAVHDG